MPRICRSGRVSLLIAMRQFAIVDQSRRIRHCPVPCSLPFHPETGSQTSILMSESAVGFASATTRQNAGKLLYNAELSCPAERLRRSHERSRQQRFAPK